MDIHLAGYNVEKDGLDEIDVDGRIVGPEVFSAAYARISRSQKSISELRSEARNDIEKARKSNEKIIFGMGHHSVAEHAVFNFDLMEISRLALESVEQFRLVSYTEKSQRYVTIGSDWVMPKEIENAGLETRFTDLVKRSHRLYQHCVDTLYDRLCQHRGTPDTKGDKNDLECLAKEDARYVLPLATTGQVGLTINARNLEHLLRRFHISPLEEVRRIGEELYRRVEHIAPSLILFPHPSPFESQFVEPKPQPQVAVPQQGGHDPFNLSLYECSVEGDDAVLAHLLATREQRPLAETQAIVARMPQREKRFHYDQLFAEMAFYDAPPRHFEFVSIAFEATISASCFAQLKRHRMASLLTTPYAPALGTTVPQQLVDADLLEPVNRLMDELNAFFFQHLDQLGAAAQYLLTNAHRRRVIMRFNLRDLYHFVRLRADGHAQWEIRDLALRLEEKVREILPMSGMLLAGKDQFPTRMAKELKR